MVVYGPDVYSLLRANTPEEMWAIAEQLAKMHDGISSVHPDALGWAYVIGKLADLTERLNKAEQKLAILAAQNGISPDE